MQGRIYISGAFTNMKNVKCKPNEEWVENDPHLWDDPPTWGICRTDYRRMLDKDDYVFFVLPKNNELPQMIYGYIKIIEKMTHDEAFKRFPNKRMKNKNPNGNIITDVNGNYNEYDLDIHKDKFESIKQFYILGDKSKSKLLEPKEIKALSNSFLPTLQSIFSNRGEDVFSIIGRKGRVLNSSQINELLDWLNDNL